MQALQFNCPHCDTNDAGINEVLIHAIVMTPIHFNMDGHHEYGDAEVQNAEVDHYECASCGAPINDEFGPVASRDELYNNILGNEQVGPKEKLYKTAYCPMFECHVEITRAFQDDRDEWVFVCNSETGGLTDHLFRKQELQDFVL